jgi:hypothetical protein
MLSIADQRPQEAVQGDPRPLIRRRFLTSARLELRETPVLLSKSKEPDGAPNRASGSHSTHEKTVLNGRLDFGAFFLREGAPQFAQGDVL